jgi:hypothetical protein
MNPRKGQPRRLVTDEQARIIRENRKGLTRRQLAEQTGLKFATVCYVLDCAKY